MHKLDGKIVAKNRHKRMEQKKDSLEEWYEKMSKQYGSKKADQLRSKLTAQKSIRYYNTTGRMMPGTVFEYQGKRYVMTGRHCNGKYFRAYGQSLKDFSVKNIKILRRNTGLVYVA